MEIDQNSLKTVKPKKKEIIYINWMRSFSIMGMIYVHVLGALERALSVDDDTLDEYYLNIRIFLQVGIPGLFYYSGRAAALGFKMDRKDPEGVSPYKLLWLWIKKKFFRLIIPLIFGFFLFVIPTCYIGRMYRNQVNKDYEVSFFYFYLRYFPDEFPVSSVEWLWFLQVLFIICTLQYPFMKLYQQVKRTKSINLERDMPMIVW